MPIGSHRTTIAKCPLPLSIALIFATAVPDAQAERRRGSDFAPGIVRTEQLPSGLRPVRKRLMAHGHVGYRQAQQLADLGDGFAAIVVAKQLYDRPDLAVDAIHYFTIAASTGRNGAVKPLVSLLRRIDPNAINPLRLVAAERALLAHANSGDQAAVDGLLSLYERGSPFVASREDIFKLRAKAAARGNGAAALAQAISLMSTPDGTKTDADDIRDYLEIAASASGDPRTQAIAATLLAQVRQDIPLATLQNVRSGEGQNP